MQRLKWTALPGWWEMLPPECLPSSAHTPTWGGADSPDVSSTGQTRSIPVLPCRDAPVSGSGSSDCPWSLSWAVTPTSPWSSLLFMQAARPCQHCPQGTAPQVCELFGAALTDFTVAPLPEEHPSAGEEGLSSSSGRQGWHSAAPQEGEKMQNTVGKLLWDSYNYSHPSCYNTKKPQSWFIDQAVSRASMLVAGESRKAFFLIPTQHRASRVRGGFSSPVVFQGLYLKAHGANSPHITSHVAAHAPRPTQHPQVLVFPVPPCWWLSGAKCFRKSVLQGDL